MTTASPDPPMLHLLAFLATSRIWLMATYAICSLFLLAWEIRRGAPASLARTSRTMLTFSLLSLVFFVLMRAPTVFYNLPFNPDEAEMLANAKKFTLDMNTWRSVDTASGGPLDSFVLMWPVLIGQSPGFATARVTSMILLFSAWLAVLRLPGQAQAGVRIIVLTCLMLVLGGTRMDDYLQYSSEILPLSILTFVAALILRMVDRPADLRVAAGAAFMLGSVPFAKLQATPAALFLGLALIWLTVRSRPTTAIVLRRLTIVVAAALTPTILILGPLLLTGNFGDFWKSYIGFSLSYLNGGIGDAVKNPTRKILESVVREPTVRAYFAAMAALSVVGLAWNSAGVRRPSPALIALAIGAAFLATSLFAVITPGRAFPHYGYFLLMPAAVLAMLAWGFEPTLRAAASRTGLRFALPLAGIIFTLLIVYGSRVHGRRDLAFTTNFSPTIMAPERFFGSGDLFPDTLENDRRLLIWGWMGEWYVQSTTVPATRDMLSYNQTWPSPLRPYFRERMISDLRKVNPRLIVDAVAPGSFHYQDAASEGISSFPELKAFVDAYYVQISRSPDGDACPRTFIRKNALAEYNARYAPVGAVSASAVKVVDGVAFTPDHLVDGVVFETCPDRWLLPDRQLGSVSLELTTPQPIVSVEILNTRNGQSMDRATRSVRITGWTGTSPLWVRRADLKRYPYWSRVTVPADAGPVSRVTIAIDSFAGAGGGLNEVRLVQASPR